MNAETRVGKQACPMLGTGKMYLITARYSISGQDMVRTWHASSNAKSDLNAVQGSLSDDKFWV